MMENLDTNGYKEEYKLIEVLHENHVRSTLFSVKMNGMNGILTFTQTTITMNHNATVLIAIGQKVAKEFIAEALKHSRIVRQPTNTQRKVWRTCAAISDSDRRFGCFI